MKERPILLAIILILACSIMALFSGLGLGFGLAYKLRPAAVAEVTATAEPLPGGSYQPPERPAQRGRLLLEDDFSQPRWEVYADDEHQKGYEEGRYFINVGIQDYSFWSLAGKTAQDFVLEIETFQQSGPDNNDYGIILRHQDDANFYIFEISGDGYYTFVKLVDNELLDIIPWQQSDMINQGNDHNLIRVEAAGSNFTFYINGELVDAAIDSDFKEGDIGLLAGTYEEAGLQVAFDNLKVWAIEEQERVE